MRIDEDEGGSCKDANSSNPISCRNLGRRNISSFSTYRLCICQTKFSPENIVSSAPLFLSSFSLS